MFSAARRRAMVLVARQPLVLAFLAAVASTAMWWLVRPPAFRARGPAEFASLNTDYASQVLHLLTGAGSFSVRYPPGFPLLMAGVYTASSHLRLDPFLGLCALVLACNGAAGAAIFLLARRVGCTRDALVASVLWGTFVLPLWLSTYPSPETPFIPALFGAVLLASRAGDGARRAVPLAVGGGALLGAALLIRPIALPLLAALPLLIWRLPVGLAASRRRRLALAFLASSLLAVLPWEVWAYRRVHAVIPLSRGGVPSIVDGLTAAVDPKDHRHEPVPAPVRRLELDLLGQSNGLHSLRDVASLMGTEWDARPLAVAELVAVKAASSWYATDSSRYDREVLIVQAVYLAFLTFSAWSAWREGGRSRRLAVVAVSVCLCFWAMTILVLSIARYVTPAEGLLFSLVPAGLARLRRRRAPALVGGA